jgi:hypothetical protein
VKKLLLESSVHNVCVAAALNAVRDMHPSVVEKVFSEKLQGIVQRAINDGNYIAIVEFLWRIPDIWNFLTAALHGIIEGYVENMPTQDVMPLGMKCAMRIEVPSIKEKAIARANSLQNKDIFAIVFMDTTREWLDIAIVRYSLSNSFAEAKSIGCDVIVPLIACLQRDHVMSIINFVSENGQIHGCIQTEYVLRQIKNADIITKSEFDNKLKELSLDSDFPNL